MKVKTNEDLVQQAMVIVCEKYKNTDFEKGILPWAYAVLDNVMRDDRKTGIRRNELFHEHIDTIKEIYQQEEAGDEAAGFRELDDEIMRALSRLSNKEKTILKLKLGGHTTEEIQKQLGLTRNAVYKYLSDGRKKLSRLLEKRGAL